MANRQCINSECQILDGERIFLTPALTEHSKQRLTVNAVATCPRPSKLMRCIVEVVPGTELPVPPHRPALLFQGIGQLSGFVLLLSLTRTKQCEHLSPTQARDTNPRRRSGFVPAQADDRPANNSRHYYDAPLTLIPTISYFDFLMATTTLDAKSNIKRLLFSRFRGGTMLTSEAACLAIKIAKGLIKTASRIDVMLAEKEAIQGPLSLPLAEVSMMAAETLMANFRNRVWLREMIRN